MDLFTQPRRPGSEPAPPLADRMRPARLEDLLGQEELLGPGTPLRAALDSGELHSLILWGPPGSGKTTLARLMAGVTGWPFVPFSAVLSGIKEVKEVMATARMHFTRTARKTVVFVDEFHRFNRAQQDAFLPYVEAGEIVLVGATTENPSFAVNAALLSRMKVHVLQPLGRDVLRLVLRHAASDPRGLAGRVELDDETADLVASLSSGDARRALNVLEMVDRMLPGKGPVPARPDRDLVLRAAGREALIYDKTGEAHYNLISALHKSLRSSDPDAAVYWLARILEAGEDPLYPARRMVRFASEDVGNADPGALAVAVGAEQAVRFLGMPEGALALAQAAVYLATAPKSDAVNAAYESAVARIREGHTSPVPLHLRNPETKLMKEIGYGSGYRHAHDYEGGITDMECLPEDLRGEVFYRPGSEGFEKEIARRLEVWRARRSAPVKKPS